jgi:hypothetical protein
MGHAIHGGARGTAVANGVLNQCVSGQMHGPLGMACGWFFVPEGDHVGCFAPIKEVMVCWCPLFVEGQCGG